MATTTNTLDVPDRFAAIAADLSDMATSTSPASKPDGDTVYKLVEELGSMTEVQNRYDLSEDELVELYVDGVQSQTRARNRAAYDELRAKMPVRQQPWWQSGDCPIWCEARHSDGDPVDDRYHLTGKRLEVELTHHEPIATEWADGNTLPRVRPTGWAAQTARVDMEQHVDHADPTVLVHVGHDRVLRLSVLEARELADYLDQMADKADAAKQVADQMRYLAANF